MRAVLLPAVVLTCFGALPLWAAQLPADNALPPPQEEPAPPAAEAPPVDTSDAVAVEQPATAPATTVEPAAALEETPGWAAPAVAAVSAAAVLAVAQWASVAVTALVFIPLMAIVLASAREGNPWFSIPALATGLPLLMGALVGGTAMGATGGVGLAYVVAAGAMGWRFALAPVFAWWMGVALGALVPVGLLALVSSGLVVAATTIGTLLYAAYLEEANGLRPLDADARAKRQAAPLLFVVGVGVTAVLVGAALMASQSGAAVVLMFTARWWGANGTLADTVLVLPRQRPLPQ